MKRRVLVPLVLLLAISLLPIGCAGPVEAPPTPAMEPLKWDFTISGSTIAKFYDIQLSEAFGRIKERTDGLLDIRVVPTGVLPIKAEEFARAVSAGDLAMSGLAGAHHAGDYPIWGILDVPYLYTTLLEKRTVWEAVRSIFQREMEKENIHLLNYYPRFMQSVCTKEPVDIMDLKGMKVRSYAEHIGMIITAMGGTPVPVAWPEVYTALQTGLVEGLLTGFDAIFENNMYEVAPYSYDIGLLHGMWVCAVNKDRWDALPKNVQNIVHEELAAFEGMSLALQRSEIERIANAWIPAGGISAEKVTNPEFFDLMREDVSEPMMEKRLAVTGAVGEEIITAIEQALGVTLH